MDLGDVQIWHCSNLRKGILANKKIDIYNNGKMYRDFTYIDDIVNGIQLLINKAPNINHRKYKDDSLSPVAPFRILNIGNTKKSLSIRLHKRD